MGEMRTLNTVLGAIYSPDNINAAFRAGAKELQDWLGWLMFGDDDAGGGVLGFDAGAASLVVTVERGGGLIYNASAPSPASKWAWIYMGESDEVTVDAHHATLARVDLISLSWTQDTDTEQSVGYEGDVPALTDTQRGCQVTLNYTAGTAHADPWANKAATPSGDEALWYVYVPATSGALALVDVRRHLPGTKRRLGTAPMTSVTDVDTDASVLEVRAREADQADTAFLSSMRWSAAQDWPYFLRGKGASGDVDSGTALYPLMSLARTWWRTVPFIGKEQDLGNDQMTSIYGGSGAAYLLLDRPGTDTHAYSLSIPIPADAARALEVVAAKLRYQVTEAFDATLTAQVVDLYHVAADGTVTTVGSVTLDLATVPGAIQPETFSSLATPVVEEGDILYAQLRISCSATGTAVGAVRFYGLDVQFKEGRS